MSKIKEKIFGVVYLIVATLAFGHAANQAYQSEMAKSLETQGIDPTGRAATAGIFAAAFWPLYWSWELFEKVDGQPSGEK